MVPALAVPGWGLVGYAHESGDGLLDNRIGELELRGLRGGDIARVTRLGTDFQISITAASKNRQYQSAQELRSIAMVPI